MTSSSDEARRIQEDDDRELADRVRHARTEDEALDALSEAGGLGVGTSVFAQQGGGLVEALRELRSLSDEELVERIEGAERSRHMYLAGGGPEWCAQFCDDVATAGRDELRRRGE